MKGKMYKYIFSILLLFVALSGNSQTINGRLYTQFNNYYKWRGGAFDSVLLLPNLTATAGLRGGALRYNGADSSLYVWSGFQWRKIDGSGGSTTDTTSLSNRINLKLNISDTASMLSPYLRSNVAAATYQPIGSYLTSVPTLQQVTTQGNSTTDSINIIDGSGNRLISLSKRASGPPTDLGGIIRLKNNFNNFYSDYYATGIYFNKVNSNNIGFPDSSGTLPLRVKLNNTTYSAGSNGTIDLGTISVTPDSSIFATRFWVNSTYQPIGNYITTGSSGSLQSLTITGTNGNGHIHLRHQASLPTATGQSTVIYANSNGDFAYKNDGNYHTTFVTSANTADRSYTFQNRNYTVADNAEVVKYTDTASMLNGRLSSITLNTSGAIHTNPITFSRIGGAWSGTMSLTTQSANTIFAGPTTGSAATPTFRTLVDADIPSASKGVQWTGVDSAFAYNRAKSGFSDYSEFGGLISTTTILPGTSFQVAGTSAANTTNGWVSGVNYYQLTTHTTSTGNSRLLMSRPLGLTSDWMLQHWRIQIPALSDGTESFWVALGSSLSILAGYQTGFLFVYDTQGTMTGSAASGNWQITAANGASRTWVTTSTAVAAGAWVNLRILANNTAAYFYVDGVLVGTITTNLPITSSVSNAITPICNITKTAGTTARTVWVDYHTLDIKYNTPRP